MSKAARYVLYVICAVQFVFAGAFFFQVPIAINLWPFEGTTPLTYILISSFFAAAAASTVWATASGNTGALAGIGFDYVTILLPTSVVSFQSAAGGGSSLLGPYAVLCLIGALFGMGLVFWTLRVPIQASPPVPGLVRWSFVVFVLALLLVGIRLITKVPNSIPWKITPDLSVVIGWMFLGAAMYFVYGIVRPSWRNAAGQLAGFLAYDLVLIVPFITRLPAVAPENQVGLYIYTTVVVYSGLLAAYYLFVNKTTRISGVQTA